MSGVRQGRIIDHVNYLLERYDIDFRLNDGGVCRGLATVFSRYALDGKETDFQYKLQSLIASNNKELRDSELNNFLIEVALAFNPAIFTENMSQIHSTNLLNNLKDSHQFDSNVLDSSASKHIYKLGLVADINSWADIIGELDLKEDESIIIDSLYHSTAISKKDGYYYYYDPNLNEYFVTYNETTLINKVFSQLNIKQTDKGPIQLELIKKNSPH